MNIVFVTFEFVTENVGGGGLASYLNNISGILSGGGHNVYVITLSDRDDRLELDNGVKVEKVYVPPLKHFAGKAWLAYIKQSYRLNKRLKKLIKSGVRPDVVQYPNVNAVGLFRTKIPSVVRISSDSLLWRNSNIEGYDVETVHPCETILDRMEDFALKRADAVFGPSKSISAIISGRTGVQIDIVESPYIQKDTEDLPSDYSSLVSDRKYLLTFGQLSRMKGTQTVGDSIYELLDRDKDLYYVFAGPDRGIVSGGRYMTCMEYISGKARQYADRVIYLGCLSRQDLYVVIRGARLIILPSRIDNMPNTCLEAMHMGKVVVGTCGASFEQLIEDGVSGFLIHRDSPSELIDIVDRVMKLSDEEISRIGENAVKRIDQMNPEAVTDGVLKEYEKAIAARH